MILIAGLPGSGKTALARAIGGKVLDFDDVADALGTPEDVAEEAGLAWQAFLARIACGHADIAVAVCAARRERMAIAMAAQGRCFLLAADAPQSVRFRRIARRRRRPCHGAIPEANAFLEAAFEPVDVRAEGFAGARIINSSDIGGPMQTSVYLKISNGEVLAYADLAGAEEAEAVLRTGRAYDAEVSIEDWQACGYCARLVDGRIVLGEPESVVRARAEAAIRYERRMRLRAVDTISPPWWESMTEVQRQAWADYRQALLDIPQRPGFPWGGDVEKAPWPVKPE